MSFPNRQSDKIQIREAVEKDNPAISEIFESGSFPGGIEVKFLRSPNPLQSFQKDGDLAKVIVMEDMESHRVFAVGGCVIRNEFVNGGILRVGYLTGLKIHSDYQKKVLCISNAYIYLRELTAPYTDIYYTTILSENTSARRLLEKKRRSMPNYRYQGDYTTYCIKAGERSEVALVKLSKEELTDYYEQLNRKQNFAPVSPFEYGVDVQDYFALKKSGQVVACCGMMDQQVYKQYKIISYSRVYRFLSKLPTSLLGYPPFPKVGKDINYGSIFLFSVKENDIKLGKEFLKAVASYSVQFDILLLGFHQSNPLQEIFQNYKHIKYSSRVYTVEFGEGFSLNQSPIGLEVSIL